MAKKSNLLVCFLGISIFLFSRESTFAAQANKDFPYLYEIYINKTITNTKILPRSFPIPGTPGRVLDLTACRGEYEPASFVIQALDQITGLEVTATDLKGQGFSIPGSAIDIRVVKCWFRAGVQLSETNKCILSPELLLKDDKLVKVDLEGKRNFCRTISNSGKESYVLISDPLGGDLKDFQPKDADHLLPVDMDVGSVKQFWITLHVPEEAPPGQYEGKIKLAAANMPPSYLTLQLPRSAFCPGKTILALFNFLYGANNDPAAGGSKKMARR